MLETIANLKWYWAIVVVIVLFLIRYAFKDSKSFIGKQVAEIAESLAIAVALVFLIIRPFIVQAFFIPSASMRMTLLEHDHILVNKFIYRIIREPQRGDIVVFRAPARASQNGKEQDFIKRVIGEPGDTIEVKPGYVEVDGERYDHSTLRQLLANYARMDGWGIRAKIVQDGVLMNGKKVTARQIAASIGKPGAEVSFHPGVVVLNGKVLKEPYTAEDSAESFPKTKVPEGYYFVMGDNRNNSSDSRVWGPLERRRIHGKPMFIFWPVNRIQWVE